MTAPVRKAPQLTKRAKSSARAGVRPARPNPRAGASDSAYKEAIEQQAATAEILRAISRSYGNPQPVFEAIAEHAVRLSGAMYCVLYRYDGEEMSVGANRNPSPKASRALRSLYPAAPRRDHLVGRTILDARAYTAVLPDDKRFPGNRNAFSGVMPRRVTLAVPLMQGASCIGAIAVARPELRPYSKREIQLLETFADQAVIAIENARLFNETKEALEQQTATAEILKVISSSPADLQPVFEVILKNATRLCNASMGILGLYDGKTYRTGAHCGANPEFARFLDERGLFEPPAQSALARMIAERQPVHVHDIRESAGYRTGWHNTLATVEVGKARTYMVLPMVKDDRVIGGIAIYRSEVRPFAQEQIDLVATFASQAVIAIESVRLFNETKEALERQTATSDILKVISSSPTNVQPVFEAIVQSGLKLFPEAGVAVVLRDGDHARLAAIAGRNAQRLRERFPFPLTRGFMHGAAILDCTLVDIPDARAYTVGPLLPGIQNFLASGSRAQTVVPMIRADAAIGAISVTHEEPRQLTDKQLALFQTFADQAVIAIENVRLFNETKEALEHQTAISEVLEKISGSPADVAPVLAAVAERAARLCEGEQATVLMLEDGNVLRPRFTYSTDKGPLPNPDTRVYLSRGYVTGRAALDGTAVNVEDVAALSDTEYPEGRENQQKLGYRSFLAAPMMREGRAIGVIAVWRRFVRRFSDKHVTLVKTFADQAAIAIQNVRLFNETREALEQQTATSEILKVISRTTFDLQPVLEIVLSNARRLCEADRGTILRPGDDGLYRAVAFAAPGSAEAETMGPVLARTPIKVDRSSATGRAILDGVTVHIPDVLADSDYKRRDLAEAGGYRSILAVPMLRDGASIGVLTLTRIGEARPFGDKQIELIRVFADQAVIAIENVRLFKEIQEKTQQLEVANKHKSEFLANMSHELRTPLNAIIGFSEVLIERMFGEVNEKQADYLKDIHESGRHLLSLINDILDLSKIEAGRMELELSTVHLPTAISNAMTLIRERAQRHGIALGSELDPALGELLADERKVKQILLNLLSNAVKFTPDGGAVHVSAALVNGSVELAVRDTGIGIAPEDQGAVFEEFRQVGGDSLRKAEGTGLGLTLTKKLVQLHGGEIRLQSAPGKGSTFSFTLPVR